MTTRAPADDPGSPVRPGDLLRLTVWFGLVAGLLEVAGLALAHQSRPILELSRDYVWMTPASIGLLSAVVGGTLALLALVRPAPRLVGLTLFAGSVIASLELLLYIPRLHHAAIAALALGVGVQATRKLRARADRMIRLARRTTPWLLAITVILGGGRRALRAIGERREVSALAAAPPGAPNVILVTLDAVRAANLSLYGYGRATSPNLTRLASRGATFERALSAASWTLPSHASILTGRWHHELSTGYDAPLDGTYPTLAEFLRSKGYATGAVVANLRYCGYETGLDRGFIHYHDYPLSVGQFLASSKILRTALNNFRLRRLIRNDQHLSRKSAEMVNRAALDWLGGVRGRPFFLFLNYFDAHEPYLPPPPFDTRFGAGRRLGRYSPLHRWLWEPAMGHANMGEAERQEEIDAYDGSIAHIDSVLGLLLDRLDRDGTLANTLVIVTADHGEEFAEHRLYEHGYSLYRASVQVPLLLVEPGRIPSGIRVAEPVSLRDLPVTVADLLGFRAGQPFPGRSIAELWTEKADRKPEPIFSQVDQAGGQPDWFPVSRGTLRSVTLGGLRYIRTGHEAEELFDFDHDPAESTNLAGDEAYRSALRDLRVIVNGMAPPSDRISP